MKKGRLKEIVTELQGASKMHLKQSKEIAEHIDDMGSPTKMVSPLNDRKTRLENKGKKLYDKATSSGSLNQEAYDNNEGIKFNNKKAQRQYKRGTKAFKKANDLSPANMGRGDSYKKGELIDETDHEDSMYKSTNSPDKLISGTDYNVENVSKIQKDKKGQFMTSLDQSEYYGGPKPTSSTVSNYDQGRNQTRDTLRPAIGKKFKKTY